MVIVTGIRCRVRNCTQGELLIDGTNSFSPRSNARQRWLFGPINVGSGITAPRRILPASKSRPGAVDNTGGQILGVSASGSALSGSGVIANIEFTALAPGVSPLTFSHVFLNLSDAGFGVANGQIAVNSPVPEPVTLTLLTSGLALLGARRLRRRGRGR